MYVYITKYPKLTYFIILTCKPALKKKVIFIYIYTTNYVNKYIPIPIILYG